MTGLNDEDLEHLREIFADPWRVFVVESLAGRAMPYEAIARRFLSRDKTFGYQKSGHKTKASVGDVRVTLRDDGRLYEGLQSLMFGGYVVRYTRRTFSMNWPGALVAPEYRLTRRGRTLLRLIAVFKTTTEQRTRTEAGRASRRARAGATGGVVDVQEGSL